MSGVTLRPKLIVFAVAAMCTITAYVEFARTPASVTHQVRRLTTIPAVFQNIVPNNSPPVRLEKPQRTLHNYRHVEDRFAQPDDVPDFKVTSVECDKLFAGDEYEQLKAKTHQKQHPKVKGTTAEYMKLASNCSAFKQQRKYIENTGSSEEEDFPLAFSILTFRDVEQVERLLRAIYRPQNYYCIHIDSQSATDIHEAISAIANCFSNVFISSRSVKVQWATFSVLEPELVCMKDLWRYTRWRYFINLTGQEWPLKTNGDLVKILKAYNGGNDVEGSIMR